jgi:hypothetical protein
MHNFSTPVYILLRTYLLAIAMQEKLFGLVITRVLGT